MPDLSTIETREQLSALLKRTFPKESTKRLHNWLGQIWSFISRIKHGDLVALPLKKRPSIALGEVTGPYQYCTDLPENIIHIRPVKWFMELPRSVFDDDILRSLATPPTVCRIRQNNAEERVRMILAGKQ